MRSAVAWIVWGVLAGSALAQDMVPFVIPQTPSPKSAVALPSAAIPVDGPRFVVKDGHFAVGGKRVRIWGVNLCFGACFPRHEDAERIADRLAAAGVNSVRFHHMDTSRYPSGILDPKDATKLHPEAVERLDYFLDRLARRGIYANLNLHVGRPASRALNLPKANTTYDKIVGLFTPPLIEAQKQYARDLLTHENAYRKVRYADDPAVAFVEITNEDSLFMWSARTDLSGLPEFYAKALQERYAAWLKARYRTTAALRQAWSEGAEPLGDNLLGDPEFTMAVPAADAAPRWVMEQHEGCRMRVGHPAGQPKAARLEIEKADDTNWHLQFKQCPFALKGGKYYTVTFRARADQPRPIGYGAGQDVSPWGTLGLSGSVNLTTAWRDFRVGFIATKDCGVARLSFSVGGSPVAVELADVALRPGGSEGLREGESMEGATVALFAPTEVRARAMDRMRFLAETEKAYFDQMRGFIRKDLGVKALVTGTIVFGPLGFYGQSGMDFVDGHAYWQHPRFPGRDWDPANWLIDQVAMVDRPAQSTLPGLAAERMDGKPFTVSEYNHPAPLDAQAETVPLLAAFAAAQDWDGIWLFAYSHRTDDAGRDAFASYFDFDANPAKWGFMQAGAAIFRGGALPPLKRIYSLSAGGWEGKTVDELIGLHLRHDLDMFGAVNERMKVTWQQLLGAQLAVALEGHSGTVDSDADAEPRLQWSVSDKGRGTFMAEGPGARVLVTHAEASTPVTAAGFEVVRPRFAVLTMTALDSDRFETAGRILIAACGRCENTGMVFSPDRRTVGTNWGKAPVLIEPVEASVVLPQGRTWKCQALGPDGRPGAEVPVKVTEKGAAVVRLSPEYKTMWYLVTPVGK